MSPHPKYPSPLQPLPIKLINRLGRGLARVGLQKKPIEADALLRKAATSTGLGDFGDPSHREGLDRLVEALNGEARLSTIGRIATERRIVDLLERRLRVVDYRKRRPEVEAQEIRRPLFILGLPRTGSTILFELLAEDPDHRYPISWEVERPFPPAREETLHSDPRIAEVEKVMGQIEILAPGFRSIHEVGAELPQECVAFTAANFASEDWGAQFRVPSYRDWLVDNDMAATFRWHRHFLQHLQVDYARPRWLLKTPGHLPCIGDLVREYPDAAIVQTHRDPMQVMGSLSSLACNLHAAFSDEIDPLDVGALEVRHFSRVLDKGMRERDEIEAAEGPGRFFDFAFGDTLKRPLDAIEEMYAHFGFEWNDDKRARMQRYLDGRPREKHGKHRYTLDEFGLSEEEHGPLFATYRERFDFGL